MTVAHGTKWRFDVPAQASVIAELPRLPSDTAELCDLVVPRVAKGMKGRPSGVCVVVVRVSGAPPQFSLKERAKGLLDALHDRRRRGAKYAACGVLAPLPDDSPKHVGGLAVEMGPGPACRIEYRIGPKLLIRGVRLASIPVTKAAPNDVWADPAEGERIKAGRVAFAKGLVGAWNESEPLASASRGAGIVVRHHPSRDEDNTWSTWIGALAGASWSHALWPSGPPLGGEAPTAFASVADASLSSPTIYEVWGGETREHS